MAIRSVIGLDLDGTVLDCRVRQHAVTVHLVPEAAPQADALWALKREGHSTRAALEALGLTVPEGFDQDWRTLIEQPAYLDLDALLPGTKKALDALSQIADLHLITARQNARGVRDTLSRLAIADVFSNIKVVPAGAGAIGAKTQYLRSCGAIAHCGDSEVDGRSAEGAGIAFWAVTSGQRSEAFLRRHTTPARLDASLYAIAMAYAGS